MKLLNKIALTAFLFISIITITYSQDLNDYKYILVPEKFEEMKVADQYRLNGLTNYLFNENGFISFIGKSNLPEDAFKNNCLVLNAELLNESGFFQTKVAIQLKNCRDEVVYTSQYGESRDKKYIVAYNEALRASLKDLSSLNYNYIPKIEKVNTESSQGNDPKVEISTVPKKETQIKPMGTQGVDADINLVKSYNATLVPNTISDFQVFNSEGRLVYIILYTGREELYMVKDMQAIIYKKEAVWVLADRSKGDLNLKVLEISFN
ncbi:hypothetical protein [Aurantibacter aestuarii]|uniref:Uncharacterized protein n=1 Tax=Aurantibacter aestuarii TaxID=1266046 RepID=A0A2T1NG03_9FLAO|nr:hypothetical protein [Aurantibacter aestuarii]PSG91693.1 hypothetical protein C7H52_00850 [Aurantibacter aestuarii]